MAMFVRYKVGFTGQKIAGPYEPGEVQYQADDIRGYEGVYDVVVTDDKDPETMEQSV